VAGEVERNPHATTDYRSPRRMQWPKPQRVRSKTNCSARREAQDNSNQWTCYDPYVHRRQSSRERRNSRTDFWGELRIVSELSRASSVYNTDEALLFYFLASSIRRLLKRDRNIFLYAFVENGQGYCLTDVFTSNNIGKVVCVV
jgi:hypothetical protein